MSESAAEELEGLHVANQRHRDSLWRSAILGVMIASSGILTASERAVADAWPTRAVTVVVPGAPGGNTDIMARMAADQLAARIGQPFVIDNKPGAGGAIATTQVARATPNGYTIMFGAASQLALVPLVQKVSYDAEKDIVPAVAFGSGAMLMAVKRDLPVNSLQEFLAYAKANPGKLNYGVGGSMTVTQLTAALFVNRAGLKMTQINYRGGAQAIADLLGGNIDMYFGNSSELLPFLGTDRMKILAVSTAERIKQAPDVPAIAEVIPGFEMRSWQGFMVPAGTPQEVIDRIATETIEALKSPKVLEQLSRQAIDPSGAAGAELDTLMAQTRSLYREAVTAAGITQPKAH